MTKSEKQHRLNFYIAQAKININEAEAALYDDKDIDLADKYFTAALDFLDCASDIVDNDNEFNDSEVRKIARELDDIEVAIYEEFKEFVKISSKVHKSVSNIDIFVAKASHHGYSHSDCVKCFEVATEAWEYLNELHIEGLLPSNTDLTEVNNDYWIAFDRYTTKYEAELS